MLGQWIWRHDTETGATKVVADGFAKPNGLAFSPDESTLYVSDTGCITGDGIDSTAPRSIYAYDVVGSGLRNRRLLYVTPSGIPNGIKTDKKGRIYAGCGDGVHVLSPEGELLGRILTSLNIGTGMVDHTGGVTNLCFGSGSHAGTLFMLAEDAIFSVQLNL